MDKKGLLGFIKNLRSSSNISQKSMAQMLGISHRAYQRLENGESNLKVFQLFSVLEILNPNFKQYFLDYFKKERFVDSWNGGPTFFELFKDNPMKIQNKAQVVDSKKMIDIIKASFDVIQDKNVGYWEVNIKESTFFWSDEMYNIYDFEKGSEITMERLKEVMPRHDFDSMNESFTALFKNGTPYSNTHKVTRKNGDEVSIQASARRIKIGEQDVIFGIAQSI